MRIMRHIQKFLNIVSFVLGIGLFLEGITETIRYNKKTEDYESTQGTYIECEIYREARHVGRRYRSATYTLIYEYQVEGVRYTVKTDHGTGAIPKIGSVQEILYNPENPAEAVVTGTNKPKILLFVGLLFILVPSIMVLAFFAVSGKLGRYSFNIMDIIIGSVMLLAGFGVFYMIAGGFSVAELFQRAGPFALIPLMFIAVAFFLFWRGLFTKQVQE